MQSLSIGAGKERLLRCLWHWSKEKVRSDGDHGKNSKKESQEGLITNDNEMASEGF